MDNIEIKSMVQEEDDTNIENSFEALADCIKYLKQFRSLIE